MNNGWREWVRQFPSVKAFALLCVVGWIITVLGMVTAVVWGYGYDHEPSAGVLGLFDRGLDALKWLTGFAISAVIGKRATEKPDVIRAEGEVQAKTIVADAQAKVLTRLDG